MLKLSLVYFFRLMFSQYIPPSYETRLPVPEPETNIKGHLKISTHISL